MKIKEILENYNSLKASITIAESEIEDLKNEILDIKSTNIDGMPKSKGEVISKIENFVADKEEKIIRKQSYINSTKYKIGIVESLVKTLKRYNQSVIEWRFFDMMSIEEIATKKERSYEAIKKTIKISISIMQREYNQIRKVPKKYP